MTFSPPDQEANARREKEEIEAKERSRTRRISEAKQKGQLLVFSPNSMTCRNFDMDDEGEGEEAKEHRKNAAEEEEQSTGSNESYKSQTSGLTSSQQSYSQPTVDHELKEDIRGIKETLELVAKDRARLSDAGLLQQTQDKIALEAERAKTETLQNAKTKLEVTVTDLQSKLAENKEEFSVETSRLQTEFDAAKRESAFQIKSLEDKIAKLKEEKAAYMDQIRGLEEDLKQTKEMLAENENDTEAISELMEKIEQFKEKEANAEEEKSAMKAELADMENIRQQLEKKVKEYEQELEAFKNNMTDSDSKLQVAMDKLKAHEAASEKEIQDRESTIADLMERINGLRAEKQESQKIEEMNKELHSQLELLKASTREQDQQILDLKDALEEARQKDEQNRESFNREKIDAQKTISELEHALQTAADKLRIAKENEDKQSEEARRSRERIQELERQLQDTTNRLQDTEYRLNTSDQREDELLRKLQESDKIRVALHNRVTQLSGNIRVFVRVRPTIPGEEEKAMAELIEKEKNKRKRKATPIQMENPFHFPGQLDARSSSDASDDITKVRSNTTFDRTICAYFVVYCHC